MSTVEERSYIELARREKRAALEAAGVPAFAYRFDRTHTVAEARELYRDEMGEAGPTVSLAGRIASLRAQGKTSFLDLEDGSGRIQVYLRRDELGEHHLILDHLDLDDHIGITGRLFRTKSGELSVRPTQLALLGKSLRPLPRGKRQVHRRRRGDLRRPDRSRGALPPALRRPRGAPRSARGVSPAGPGDQLDARGSSTSAASSRSRPRSSSRCTAAPRRGRSSPTTTRSTCRCYLRIADELYLKRLLVGGLERVYEIGHDFRNEGMDRTHNPEFTMLEVYQAYADYTDMMALTEGLVAGAIEHCLGGVTLERGGTTLDFTPPFRRVSFIEGIRERSGLDLRAASDEEMRQVLTRAGEPADAVAAMSGGKLQDEVFKVVLEPHLVQPTFVVDYPKPLSPLAKEHRRDPALTERFELFVGGRELANAFSELNDPDDQRRRFEDQVSQRAAGNEEAHAFDADYIRALEYGMPPAGGMGMGVDRLLMVIADQPSIRDVILFPAMRPEED